jgi:hypothetical protein
VGEDDFLKMWNNIFKKNEHSLPFRVNERLIKNSSFPASYDGVAECLKAV